MKEINGKKRCAETGRDRLEMQLRFVIEMDKLKRVMRQTILTDTSRRETSAEHSWQLAIMAILLSEYAVEELNLLRVLKMIAVHDVVEIDAGDTFCYDPDEVKGQELREREAADRIFSLLPEDQGAELRALWEEFEARESPESRFAASMDSLQPLLQNYATKGERWQKNGVRSRQVLARNRRIEASTPTLWDYASELIEKAVDKGFLLE